MTYMLNTNICVFLMRGRPSCVRERLAAVEEKSVYLSSIVISELWFGVYNSSRMERNKQALECFLDPFEELAYGHEANEVYGRQRVTLRKAGTPIGAMDLLIASHALSEDAVLITNNTREFSRIEGLMLEDWTTGP